MSRGSVLFGVIIAAVILLSADFLAQRMAVNSVPRQVVRTVTQAPQVIDVLAIGNSLIAAGFDPDAVQDACQKSGRPCVAVNGGLGASGLIEHLALTRLALRGHRVKTLIYGFFDQQLSTDIVEKNSDLIGNHSMLYYQEPELTLQYARFNALDRLSFQVYRSSALLRERSAIWARVEKLRRGFGSVGMPQQETNQFGRKADFAALEANDSQTFVLACQKVIESGDLLSAPVLALLQQAREHDTKVILVEMPMHPLHLKRFYAEPVWEQFRARTRLAAEKEGAAYLDASVWIPDGDLFDDHLHLSKQGADQFSRLLTEYLIQQQSN